MNLPANKQLASSSLSSAQQHRNYVADSYFSWWTSLRETRVTASKINASYDRRPSRHGRVYSYWYINSVVSMLFDTCTGQIHTNSMLPVLNILRIIN